MYGMDSILPACRRRQVRPENNVLLTVKIGLISDIALGNRISEPTSATCFPRDVDILTIPPVVRVGRYPQLS